MQCGFQRAIHVVPLEITIDRRVGHRGASAVVDLGVPFDVGVEHIDDGGSLGLDVTVNRDAGRIQGGVVPDAPNCGRERNETPPAHCRRRLSGAQERTS